MDNDIARQHYLTEEESKFLHLRLDEIISLVEKIKKESNLKGSWTVSNDYKWLVRLD